MKIKPNISFNFSSKLCSCACPGVNSVCCYPLKKGRMGNTIRTTRWALEYHSKYAGEMCLKNDTKTWQKREAKTVYMYAPGCTYCENTLNADLPIQETYIIFRDSPQSAISKLVDSKLLFAKFYTENNEMEELFLKAVKYCEAYGERAFWKTQSVLMEIIHLLSNATKDKNGNWRISEVASATFASFCEKVENYLMKNIDRNLKAVDIASYMKISESTLNHKYKEESGIAPIEKFIEMRINFAKGLLLKGERLKIIAEMTGFYDEYHLSKTFKKATSFSPREYKNSFAKS